MSSSGVLRGTKCAPCPPPRRRRSTGRSSSRCAHGPRPPGTSASHGGRACVVRRRVNFRCRRASGSRSRAPHGRGRPPRPGQDGRRDAPLRRGRRDGVGLQSVDSVSQACRQELLELDQCPKRALPHPCDAASGCRAQPDRDGDRLIVLQEQGAAWHRQSPTDSRRRRPRRPRPDSRGCAAEQRHCGRCLWAIDFPLAAT